ncbi:MULTISPECIES: P-loop NTPase fold protein [unclassified Caballeronia]|uniref:KAP family P-loop NTPase fold protein n=1 Tax=unclassified Caballeronia TaxID=2646786 RepID=UPI0028563392|nr:MULTISPECIES: P-loop NTPase fold protein [unclassified Caballeronia]MDR5777704.1 P-loop NTPase fold protein [Caballeronia sp. LZ002]MDR5798852.1 P-loop NTPase fold protein [Caballeronia sp. LZ001]MDR5853137.1 P-loop NTPase fold protein [Caballeronia sp. LZ003]
MKKNKRQSFGDDRAKSNPWEDDRLGVSPLAKRLAKVISAIDAPNGFVIGVNGAWGGGKSTLLNFTCTYLQKYREEAEAEADRVHHIDFRPWMASGHQDLVAAFFKVLSETVGPRENVLKRVWRRLVSRFGGSSDAVLDAIAKLAVVADIGISRGAATGVVSIVKQPLKQKLDEFLKEPSLQSAHRELAKLLGESGKRFLVTIDDIDRLSKPEVMSIMQMVKTVGQLPNVVYLLAYDRSKLHDAFDETDTASGPRYAEKIIQHEIELPYPTRNSLLCMLDSEIAFLLKAIPSDMRWVTLRMHGVHRWLLKPRDVLLLTNALKFSWPALEGEIDPGDLLTMEGLRLFEPDACCFSP